MIHIIRRDLNSLSDKEKANTYLRFFKTGKGEYGEGDVFLGVTMPKIRILAKNVNAINIKEVEILLHSKIHEERMLALIILVNKFKKADNDEKGVIYDLYLRNTNFINNWDLVDLTASNIVGAYTYNNDTNILTTLAKSDSLWERRIAIVSTHYFIKQNKYSYTLNISTILLSDKHDLIHKAVGWMLREVGKKDIKVLKHFIKLNYSNIPRTTLRYAIERFPDILRLKYLKNIY